MKRFCLWLALLSVFSFAREVPVRYLTMDDSLEREAIFVKLVKDTVYLREYTPEEIAAKQAKALAEAEEQAIIEKYGDIEDSSSVNSTTEEASESVEPSEEEATVPEEAVSQEPAADDFEAALLVTDSLKEAKADSSATDSLKVDSLKTDSVQAVEAPKDVYIRLFKYDFKRLINVESGEMVDLTLSDYEYTEEEEEEEYIPLYPEGKANLLVKSIPEACSLFVNGVPLEMLTPDTIKNIKPGKYNISIKKRLKDVDWWGNKAVKINDDSLNVIEVEVERPSTRLTVNTVPEAVEVYLDESPNENVMPHYMLGDHFFSSKYEDPKWQGDSQLYANTDRKTRKLKQKLDEHLVGVKKHALEIVNLLPKIQQFDNEEATAVYDNKALKKTSTGSYLWQQKTVNQIISFKKKQLVEGAFIVNMASTGCGKTFANAKIMQALSVQSKSIRFVLALGLRSLTLQTGDEYRERVGLRDDELAVLIGSKAVIELHNSSKTISDSEDSISANEYIGSESLELLMEEDVDYTGILKYSNIEDSSVGTKSKGFCSIFLYSDFNNSTEQL
jgi:hypothetical protein